jgi:hypothetical protein
MNAAPTFSPCQIIKIGEIVPRLWYLMRNYFKSNILTRVSRNLIIDSMATNQQGVSETEIVRELVDSYDEHKLAEITSRRFNQADMLRWLESMVRQNVVIHTALGSSAEGRTISLYSHGEGPVKVLLWSQMHGDEPTATMALLDMLSFLVRSPNNAIAKTIQERLNLLLVPMLNPDGAERFTRRTAQLIDMNRDAVAQRTPEARILRATQQKYRPQFGFNLHDQDPRLTVGSTKEVTAIALLAPAFDQPRSDNDVRRRAKKVASVFASVMNQVVPGHTAKYDDTFDPRAFGDSVQMWGTSTVLVESGGWPNDRDRMFIRKLNYVGLLVSLYSIATGEYERSDVLTYESLPFNSKNLYDIIVRGVDFKPAPGMPSIRADLALNVEEMNREQGNIRLMARVVDIGDLTPYGAFDERDGNGISLSADQIQLDKLIPWEEVNLLLK